MISPKNNLDPPKVLVFGFLGTIIFAAVLLYLPFFHESGKVITFEEALFTATSAITVTGLNVIDPGSTFNHWGEFLLILLIQIGGLGFMTFAIWFFALLGKKIGLKQRLLMQENLGQLYIQGIVKLALHLLWITISIEMLGAFLIALRWHQQMGWGEALFQGLFHAVSAFNNAGFSLFSTGLSADVHDPIINLVIIFLILTGGIGFVVILDLIEKKFKFKQFSLHTKITLLFNILFIGFGCLFFLVMEYHNQQSIAGFSVGDKIIASLFQIVTTRTAGFNTLEIGNLTQATLFLFIIYMFIGASSGSTGGGVKVTTFAVILITVQSILRGKKDAMIFERRIPEDIMLRAMVILVLSIVIVVGTTLLLDITERGQSFLAILFEATSAFGTVGLSTGLTPQLSEAGRWIIMMTMFIGRLGPLTIGFALARKKEKVYVRYPEEKIMIG